MRSPDHMEEEEKGGGESKEQQNQREDSQTTPAAAGGGGAGGWGGWGFSSFSVLSDLQKAAEEISRNAVEAAKNAAKVITDIEPEPEEEEETTVILDHPEQKEEDDNNDALRASALDRLENASEDTLLGQGLKVLDDSVETLTSGAWLALGSAWKGGSTLVHKLEHSAASLADSIQHGALPLNASSIAPSLLETGRSLTAKGIQVLERVGKETVDLLITETGLEAGKSNKGFYHQADGEQFEEITFERCFYIYGGPEQLEELEALSNHYALLFNRKKAKLSSEQKFFYDGKLKQVQEYLDLSSAVEESSVDPEKGKYIEMADDASAAEMKLLHDSSVRKAADLAAGFAAALGGLAMNEIIQRTTDRLETVHADGVHRLSEICSCAVSHLLILGKSVISTANKLKSGETTDSPIKVDCPEDSVSKSKVIRSKAQFMSRDVESVANSFLTGISEIIEAYQAAIPGVSSGNHDDPPQNSIQEKANNISNHLRADQATALGKIQDALQYLAYVVLSTSMPTA